jgi:hypothetical protein
VDGTQYSNQNSWDTIHITFTIMNNKAVNPSYSMLFGCPWLKDAKIIHDQGTNMVIIEGNNIIKTIFISKYLNGNIKNLRW